MTPDPYIGRPLGRLAAPCAGSMVPAETSRAHLARLTANGMSYNMIARAAGITGDTVASILDAEYPTVRPSIETAVLSVTERPHSQQVLVLSYGARRRIEGLSVMGWSYRRMSAMTGLGFQTLRHARSRPQIRWRVHNTIADFYSAHSLQEGGDNRSKLWAQRMGFVHPMMWDDVDDFHEIPMVPKTNRRAAFWAEYEHFRGFGWDDRRISEALGMQLDAFQARVRRNQGVAA